MVRLSTRRWLATITLGDVINELWASEKNRQAIININIKK